MQVGRRDLRYRSGERCRGCQPGGENLVRWQFEAKRRGVQIRAPAQQGSGLTLTQFWE